VLLSLTEPKEPAYSLGRRPSQQSRTLTCSLVCRFNGLRLRNPRKCMGRPILLSCPCLTKALVWSCYFALQKPPPAPPKSWDDVQLVLKKCSKDDVLCGIDSARSNVGHLMDKLENSFFKEKFQQSVSLCIVWITPFLSSPHELRLWLDGIGLDAVSLPACCYNLSLSSCRGFWKSFNFCNFNFLSIRSYIKLVNQTLWFLKVIKMSYNLDHATVLEALKALGL